MLFQFRLSVHFYPATRLLRIVWRLSSSDFRQWMKRGSNTIPAFFSSCRWKWSECHRQLLKPVVFVVWPLTSLPHGCSRFNEVEQKLQTATQRCDTYCCCTPFRETICVSRGRFSQRLCFSTMIITTGHLWSKLTEAHVILIELKDY